MKKFSLVVFAVLAILLLTTSIALADKPTGFDAQGNETKWADAKNDAGEVCTKIQSGLLYGSDGSLLTTGYNEWGYNYQAHMFNGMYCDYHPYYRPGGAGHEACIANYGDVKLVMKWNDAWLSNVDCDGDGLLDRHYGHDSYISSGAWTTNHMLGSYDLDTATCNWDYFVKIVAAPADAYTEDGFWYNADGVEIGEVIWGAFAVIQQVENDACAGIEGVQYLSPDHPGLGNW
jgi:hypothetical protein